MGKEHFKTTLLLFVVLTGFIFAVSLSVYYVQSVIHSGDACSCSIPIPLLIVVLSSLGLFTGSVTYYLMMDRIIEKYKKKRGLKKAVQPILGLLKKKERLVVQKLVESKSLTQAQLSKKLDLNRVQVSRVLQKLEDKNFIKKTKKGKTNKIELSDEIKELF